jgi:hypothetical protein
MLRFNNFNEDSFENVAEVWGVGGGGQLGRGVTGLHVRAALLAAALVGCSEAALMDCSHSQPVPRLDTAAAAFHR